MFWQWKKQTTVERIRAVTHLNSAPQTRGVKGLTGETTVTNTRPNYDKESKVGIARLYFRRRTPRIMFEEAFIEIWRFVAAYWTDEGVGKNNEKYSVWFQTSYYNNTKRSTLFEDIGRNDGARSISPGCKVLSSGQKKSPSRESGLLMSLNNKQYFIIDSLYYANGVINPFFFFFFLYQSNCFCGCLRLLHSTV